MQKNCAIHEEKQNIKSVSVAIYEVPAARGLVKLVEEAVKGSGKNIQIENNEDRYPGTGYLKAAVFF